MKQVLFTFLFLTSILPFTHAQQVGATWDSPTTGTLDGNDFTFTAPSPSLVSHDLSVEAFAAAPIGTLLVPEMVIVEEEETWSVTFASPISNLRLYVDYNSAFSPIQTITFNQNLTAVSLLNMTNTGNSIILPQLSNAIPPINGIFEFSGPITTLTLTIAENIAVVPGLSKVRLTFGLAEPLADPSVCDQIDALADNVTALNLPGNTEGFLLGKLADASQKYQDGNNNAALGKLGSFINKVNAKTPSQISASEAAILIDLVNTIIDAINSGDASCAPNGQRITAPSIGNNMVTTAAHSLEMEVFPNPAVDVLNVNYQIPTEGDAMMTVMDLTGRVVYQESINNDDAGEQRAAIQTSNFAKGVYFLRINSDRNSKTVKFFKH